MSVIIDIDEEWVKKLEDRRLVIASHEQARPTGQEPTIFKVLEVLRGAQPEAYEPMIVSLGPYHHHKRHLSVTNQHKWSLLNMLLSQNPRMSLKDYLKLIKAKAIEARNAYPMQSIEMCENQFMMMMLLDCVFVIEILWLWKASEGIENLIFMNWQGSRTVVARDMLLLENQLPFFLLETLFDSAFPNKRGRLKHWVVQFFNGFICKEKPQVPDDATRIHHILHLFYLCIVPLNTIRRINARPAAGSPDHHRQSTSRRVEWLPNATRLKEKGIKFRKKQKSTNFIDYIRFEKGVLEIPRIEVDDDTNILLRNVIALEQCRINGTAAGDDPVTAYALFMSCIIDTAADVEILQRKGIIVSRLGSNKQVAQLFNRLCKEVVVDYDRCYLARLFEEVNEHTSATWNAMRADVRRKYLCDPWSLFSFISTVSLLYIAVTQLFFTLQSHARPP